MRSGQRLVAITFIESLIADQHQRMQVYELNEIAALEGNTMRWENRVRLDVVRQNLMRMWSTTYPASDRISVSTITPAAISCASTPRSSAGSMLAWRASASPSENIRCLSIHSTVGCVAPSATSPWSVTAT